MPQKHKLLSDLEDEYQRILSSSDVSHIYEDPNLSGLFLACPRESYFESSRKVIIIGQETKSWRKKECKIKNASDYGLSSIRESMASTLKTNSRRPGTSKFGQFYLKASEALSDNMDKEKAKYSALWSNQFCISHKNSSPIKSVKFSCIEELSAKLLQAQFEILKPDVAIFTVGSSRDKYIKSAFEYDTVNVVVPGRLWHFKIGETHCFRCNHPRWPGAKEFLDKAITLALEYT